MTNVWPKISAITINVNKLNSPIKRGLNEIFTLNQKYIQCIHLNEHPNVP